MTQPNENWVKVFTNTKSHLIEMAKQLLENEGFEALVFNQKDSSYLFGDIYLYVLKDDFVECQKLINLFKKDLNLE